MKDRPTDQCVAASGRVVFFEHLANRQRPLVAWYLFRGATVYYKILEDGCYPDRGRSWPMMRGTVRQLTFDPPLYRWMNPSYDEAFDRVEELYERHYAKTHLIRHLARCFQSDAVHLAFKKALLERLSEYFYYRLLTERVRQKLSSADHIGIVLLNARHADRQLSRVVATTQTEESLPRWGFPLWMKGAVGVSSLRERLEVGLRIVKIMGWAIFTRLHRSKRIRGGTYELGVAVVSPTRELHDGLRSSGFLADGQLIKKEDVLLIPITRLNQKDVAWLTERRFNVSKPAFPVSWKTFRQTLRMLARLFLSIPWYPPWMLTIAATLVRDYVIWQTFAEHYHVRKFVTYSDHGISHIPRNIILQQHGTRVWHYHVSANMTESMPPLNGHGTPSRFDMWGYLYYDVMVCWGERFIRYFRRHHQHVGRYIPVGCLWSEHVRLLKEGGIQSTLLRQLQARGWHPGQKIVSVFPTWYNIDSQTAPEDGLEFIRSVERLMIELPELFVVLKEKHERWRFINHRVLGGKGAARIYRAYEELEKHPRCWLPGHTADTSEIAAISDLVISFPFTSVSIEAMIGGVKALYFDPYGKYRGGYYDGMPGLVAHSYQELKSRVVTLLYETTLEEYRRYLETYVKGDTDPFLDGEAITRFRILLGK